MLNILPYLDVVIRVSAYFMNNSFILIFRRECSPLNTNVMEVSDS